MKFASTGLRAVFRPRRYNDVTERETSQSGFTLFETLTAMLVLSIGLVALFEAHQRALKTAGIAADYLSARILAQGLLADTVDGWGEKVAARKGTDGEFAWMVDVAPDTASWAQVQTRGNWKLRRVRVIVSWPGGRHLELDSLKLGRSNG